MTLAIPPARWRRPSRRMLFGGCLALAAAPFVCGCSRSPSPPLAKVTGVVRLDGAPIAGVEVRFVPDTSKGPDGRMATGSTGADGRFVLSCFAPGDGALVGFHRVAIVPQPGVEIVGSPERPMERLTPAAPVPRRYSDERTSGLTAEVIAGPATANHVEFDLATDSSSRKGASR